MSTATTLMGKCTPSTGHTWSTYEATTICAAWSTAPTATTWGASLPERVACASRRKRKRPNNTVASAYAAAARRKSKSARSKSTRRLALSPWPAERND